MISSHNTRRWLHVKVFLLVGACLAGLVTAVGSTASARVDATALATAPAAKYPKAGFILQGKLAAHARPAKSSPTIKVFHQFRSDFRPTTLLVLGEAKDAKGLRWLRLSMPMRPNGKIGWVLAAAVQMRPVHRTIAIDLSSRKLRILQGGKTRFATRVAVGRPGMETPTGRFYLTATFKPKEHFLGAFAFETSAYSKLSEWPGGGVVGLHGTSMPWLLGQAVSHGCVRVQNDVLIRLYRLADEGTPVEIRA